MIANIENTNSSPRVGAKGNFKAKQIHARVLEVGQSVLQGGFLTDPLGWTTTNV